MASFLYKTYHFPYFCQKGGVALAKTLTLDPNLILPSGLAPWLTGLGSYNLPHAINWICETCMQEEDPEWYATQKQARLQLQVRKILNICVCPHLGRHVTHKAGPHITWATYAHHSEYLLNEHLM